MIYTDYNKIKKVTFKVPKLMHEGAEEEVIGLFNDINNLKDHIADLREEASKLETKLKALEATWLCISPLLDIEYETEEGEDIHDDVNISFNFSADINKNVH